MNYFKFCRCLLVGILMGLLVIAEISAETFDGVDFPAGSISFADSVQEFIPGSYTEQTNTANALGAPDYAGGSDGSTYFSLGNGGTAVLKFTDNALTASGDSDLDLWIFEAGNVVEATFVSISQDGSNWIDVGHISGSTSGIDIDAYVSNGVVVGENYLYVKLIDDEDDDYQTAAYAGADIDAVGAISSAALPLSADFISLYLDLDEIDSFSIEGGSPPYTVTSYDELIIDVDESTTGVRFFVTGLGDGTTTITVRDSTAALVEVAVTVGVGKTDRLTTSTYDSTTGEVVIPDIAILGAEDSTHYQLKGNVVTVLEMINLFRDMFSENPDMTDEQINALFDASFCIMATGFDPSKVAHISPSGNTQDTTPTFTWTQDPVSTWYRLWVGYPGDIKVFAEWYEASKICTNGTCTVTTGTEFNAGNYEWYVKSWNDYGKVWSDGMSFTVNE